MEEAGKARRGMGEWGQKMGEYVGYRAAAGKFMRIKIDNNKDVSYPEVIDLKVMW